MIIDTKAFSICWDAIQGITVDECTVDEFTPIANSYLLKRPPPLLTNTSGSASTTPTNVDYDLRALPNFLCGQGYSTLDRETARIQLELFTMSCELGVPIAKGSEFDPAAWSEELYRTLERQTELTTRDINSLREGQRALEEAQRVQEEQVHAELVKWEDNHRTIKREMNELTAQKNELEVREKELIEAYSKATLDNHIVNDRIAQLESQSKGYENELAILSQKNAQAEEQRLRLRARVAELQETHDAQNLLHRTQLESNVIHKALSAQINENKERLKLLMEDNELLEMEIQSLLAKRESQKLEQWLPVTPVTPTHLQAGDNSVGGSARGGKNLLRGRVKRGAGRGRGREGDKKSGGVVNLLEELEKSMVPNNPSVNEKEKLENAQQLPSSSLLQVIHPDSDRKTGFRMGHKKVSSVGGDRDMKSHQSMSSSAGPDKTPPKRTNGGLFPKPLIINSDQAPSMDFLLAQVGKIEAEIRATRLELSELSNSNTSPPIAHSDMTSDMSPPLSSTTTMVDKGVQTEL